MLGQRTNKMLKCSEEQQVALDFRASYVLSCVIIPQTGTAVLVNTGVRLFLRYVTFATTGRLKLRINTSFLYN